MAIDKQNAKAKEVGHLFVSENGDAAKYARRLLDTISLNGEIAAALTELKEKFEEVLPKYAVERLETIIEASSCAHAVGLKQTTKVSTVKGLLAAYSRIQKMREVEEQKRPSTRVSLPMQRIKEFVRRCNNAPKKRRACTYNVTVMTTRGHKKQDISLVKHRCDYSDIWKMRSACQLRVILRRFLLFYHGIRHGQSVRREDAAIAMDIHFGNPQHSRHGTHACCGPAPPKQASACLAMSNLRI